MPYCTVIPVDTYLHNYFFMSKKNPLTKRELQIIVCISDGLSNREIGKKLHISYRTADTHRTNIMRKTKSHNAAMLVRYACDNNII